MIRPELARYMLRNKGRNAALQQGGLARLTHDNLADLGVTPRPLEDEGPEETAAEGGVEEPVVPVAIAEAPQRQLDVPPQAALPGAAPEELDAFPVPLTAPPMTQAAPAPVSAPRAEVETDDADELANARANDRTAAIARGFETAGRQLVAGISRTPILDTLTQQTNNVGDVRAAQKSRAEKLRMAAEAARQSRETDDKLMNSESSRILDLARAAALQREKRTGLNPELENRRLDLKEEEIHDANDRGNRALDLKEEALRKPKVAKAPKTVTGIPSGYEPDPDAPPSEDNKKKFTGLVFADQKMKGLTRQMRDVLKTAGARGTYLPGENARVKQLATQIKIEGKNIAELGALSGPDMGLMEAIAGDPTSLFSAVKDTDALLSGLDDWGGNSVAAGQKAYGIRPKAGAMGGKVRMTNGRETLDVDAGDVADAAKEGFKRVQ